MATSRRGVSCENKTDVIRRTQTYLKFCDPLVQISWLTAAPSNSPCGQSEVCATAATPPKMKTVGPIVNLPTNGCEHVSSFTHQ